MGEITNDNEHQIIFPGVVIDANDPMMLGRIRAQPEKTVDYEAVIKATNFNEEKDIWKSNDPFIFLPLLPFYTYIVPQVNEYVHLFYQNKKFKFQNQFYIPGKFSSPMALTFEHYQAAKKFLATGDLIADSLALKVVGQGVDAYYNATSKGVFPEPGDNAFMGRGTTDMILKPNEVLIRAGKTNVLNKNQFPQANNLRAFIQLSNFTERIITLPDETEIYQETKVLLVSKMIVWHISNLENGQNSFTGWIRLYDVLPNSSKVNTENFNVETITILSDGTDYSFTGYFDEFMGLSVDNAVIRINKFIENVFKGNISSSATTTTQQFPIIVTPSKLTYQVGNKFQIQSPDDAAQLTNYITFFSRIKLNEGIAKSGFFLVSGNKNDLPVIGVPPETKIVTNTPQEFISSPITYGIMGAQKVYLLSHDSVGPKGKIDINDTIYGISQELFTKPNQNIETQTYATVRGDELIVLLRKMMSFITGHVHPTSTMPPIPVSAGNGQTTSEINFLLASAENTILNQNIRIN
jgi:hypothetical protein